MAVAVLWGIGGNPRPDHAQANAAIALTCDDEQRKDEDLWVQGKPTRPRHVRDGDAYDEDTMRIAVSTLDGMFLVYDAIVPPDAQGASAGYLAYWLDARTRLIYVYGRPVYKWVDVGHALLNLQVGVRAAADSPLDTTVIAAASPVLAEAVAAALEEDEDQTLWQAATRPLLLKLMGFELREGLDSEPLPVPGWVVPEPEDQDEQIGGVSDCGGDPMLVPPPPPPPRILGAGKGYAAQMLEDLLDGIGGVAAKRCRFPYECNDNDPCTTDYCNSRTCLCVYNPCAHACCDGRCCPGPGPCCGGECCPSSSGPDCCAGYCCPDCQPPDCNCDGEIDCPCWGDTDCVGIPNDEDGDIDGDGTPNEFDDDVDGDGLGNGNDPDINGDGITNGEDDDMDGDGVSNGEDDDDDGDGLSDGEDEWPDGCGEECCGSTDPCCGISDPCDLECGDPCAPECVNCDDGDDGTTDTCDPDTGECEHGCAGGLALGEGGLRGASSVAASNLADSIELKEIYFRNDYWMYRNAPPADWGPGSVSCLRAPEWNSTAGAFAPICYGRASRITMDIVLRITTSLDGNAMLRVMDGDGVISGTVSFSVSCGTHTETVSLTTSQLPSVLDAYEPMELDWEIEFPGTTEFTLFQTTSHDIYVTYGASLGEVRTRKRMQFLCNAAAGWSSAHDVTDKIHQALDADPPFDPDDPGVALPYVDDWRLMAGVPYTGECDEQARFMVRALNLLGIAGSTYLTRASTNTNVVDSEWTTAFALGITNDMDHDGQVGEEKYWLIFDFDRDGEGDNGFEGSVSAAGHYYAVWPSLNASTKCRLLCQIGPDPGGFNAQQRWCLTESETIDDPRIIDCDYTPVGYPLCP